MIASEAICLKIKRVQGEVNRSEPPRKLERTELLKHLNILLTCVTLWPSVKTTKIRQGFLQVSRLQPVLMPCRSDLVRGRETDGDWVRQSNG